MIWLTLRLIFMINVYQKYWHWKHYLRNISHFLTRTKPLQVTTPTARTIAKQVRERPYLSPSTLYMWQISCYDDVTIFVRKYCCNNNREYMHTQLFNVGHTHNHIWIVGMKTCMQVCFNIECINIDSITILNYQTLTGPRIVNGSTLVINYFLEKCMFNFRC